MALLCPKCKNPNGTFSIGMRAYINNVTVNSNRDIIAINKEDIDLDYNFIEEFCYCNECDEEIEYSREYDPEDYEEEDDYE